jgi:hypothetical protein
VSVPEQVLSDACVCLARDVHRICVAEVVRAHMRRDPSALDDSHDQLAQRLVSVDSSSPLGDDSETITFMPIVTDDEQYWGFGDITFDLLVPL